MEELPCTATMQLPDGTFERVDANTPNTWPGTRAAGDHDMLGPPAIDVDGRAIFLRGLPTFRL